MLTEYLSYRGFVVETAADGFEAIDAAVRFRPAIILMDLMMPRMDGWEATHQLKADARTRDIPIIALSAHSQTDGDRRARAAGCAAFISKPCNLDHLVDVLLFLNPTKPRRSPIRATRTPDDICNRCGNLLFPAHLTSGMTIPATADYVCLNCGRAYERTGNPPRLSLVLPVATNDDDDDD